MPVRYKLGLNPNLMGKRMRQRTFAIGVVMFVSCACLQGCTQVMFGGATYGVEKVYLAKDRSPVYVTEHDNAVVGCEFKKDVEEQRWLGGFFPSG